MRTIFLAVLASILAGCTAYVPVEVPPAPVAKSKYVQELEKFRAEVGEVRRQYPDKDKSAQVLIVCDQMGFVRGSDGHKLCTLRGIDRYVDHMTAPISERYLRRDDEIYIQVPKPQPVPVPVPQYPAEPIRTPDGGYIYPSYVPPMTPQQH